MTINMFISVHTGRQKSFTNWALRHLGIRRWGTWLLRLYWRGLGLWGDHRRWPCRNMGLWRGHRRWHCRNMGLLGVLNKNPRLRPTRNRSWMGMVPKWPYSTNWHQTLSCGRQYTIHYNKTGKGCILLGQFWLGISEHAEYQSPQELVRFSLN